MQIRYSILIGCTCLTITTAQAHALAETSPESEAQKDANSSALQEVEISQETKEGTDLEKKRKEQERIELENALNKERLEKELAVLAAEVERLMLEKEAMKLKWEIEQEKNQRTHEREMLELNQQKEKLRAEGAVSQAKVDKVVQNFNLTSAELYTKVSLLKAETDQLRAEVEQTKANQERTKYADGTPTYLQEPLRKDGTLVISDRRIELNGIITPWRANYITDRIQYFNNKDTNHPIFLVIGSSPGGSVIGGFNILKAMQHSQAPVYVIVKSFAASMAACLTSLAAQSYAYPNAIILHHQPWTFTWGNVREQKEAYEFLKEIWQRLGGPIAKKMGISLKDLDKRLYEKSTRGDWEEFADNAKQIKWIDYVVKGTEESAIREIPDPVNYTWEKYRAEYFGATEKTADNAVVYLPPLGPKDFYYLYNPDSRYQLRLVK